MKVLSLHRFIPTLLTSFTLVLGACQDNGNSGTKPPEDEHTPREPEKIVLAPIGKDDPRPILPCDGKLCYSSTDPETQNAYNDFYHKLAPDIPEDLEDPLEEAFLREQQEDILQTLQFMSDSYSACNYTEKREGIVVAECPSWTTDVRGCPGFFFDFYNHENLPGILELSGKDPQKYLCFYGKRFTDAKTFNCRDGQVSSGALTTRWNDNDSHSSHCMTPDLCMQLSEDEGIKGEDVCFYGDFTTADSGEIAPQDCDSLEPGTCAINCPCGSAADGADQGCQFLSEDNPVGICGLGSCSHAEDYRNCPLPSLSCAMPHVPTWVSAAVQNGPMKETPLGVCVEPSACDAWSETNDILDTCGTPGIILPDAP